MSMLNNTSCDILELLGRFKFLTISQLLPLLGKSMGYVREQLAGLSQKGYIKSYRLDRPGKAENMYYLTEAGKEVLLTNAKVFAGDIKLPIGTPLVVRDYSHRKQMIDIHIALYYHLLQLDMQVVEFTCYFDKQGENRKSGTLEAKTKIPLGDHGFFIPDGIMLTEQGEEKTIYLIEMYCDNSSTRVLEQLDKHRIAIALGTPGERYGMKKNPFVLSAFEYSGIRDKVITKLRQDGNFMAFTKWLYFCTLDELKQNPATAWKDMDDNTIVFT